MNATSRPLSPHLSAYGWRITMLSSILHRFSGVALAFGMVVLVAGLLALAGGPADFATFAALAASIPGQVVLIGLSLAAFYHLLNGIRHLAWDAGYGFEKATATATAWVVVLGSVFATALFWAVIYFA